MDKVGKVKLDYSVYSGQDLYSDGDIEDELLKIARDCSVVEFPKIIEERANWPILYHLSSARENIVRWLPIKKTDKVLEVGAGCGAISGALCEMAGQVISCDLSKRRSLINANRHQDCDNLTIHVGNFTDVEKTLPDDFDYICLIGVFEYGQHYIDSDTPYEDFLKLLMKHLSPNGRLVIAIENRLGLKYIAGCKEDHLGSWFSSLEGYNLKDGVKTFSKAALTKIFEAVGIKDYHFYYPYPDYKFMNTIFSDKRLPKVGELVDNMRYFDRDRMLLFDEGLAFDQMIQDGYFPEYSNSFMVVLGQDTNVEYARFSNDRLDKYAIKTSIETEGEEKIVKKRALYKSGDEHIAAMQGYCEALTKRYAGGELKVNKCEMTYEDGRPVANFEFVEGKALGEILSPLCNNEDNEEFMKLFRAFVSKVSYGEGCKVCDRDLVFNNIIVNGDTWTLIDYEWTDYRDIPIRELAFRSIYCYLLEHKNTNKLNLDLTIDELGLTQELARYIREDEAILQKKITGNRLSMGELLGKIGNKCFEPVKMIERYTDHASAYRLQVYRAKDNTFSEDNSYFVEDAYENENKAVVDINLSAEENLVRIDPLMESCMVIVTQCLYNGVDFPVGDKKSLAVNGRRIDSNSFVFASKDPNMEFSFERLPKASMNTLHIEMDIHRLPEDAARKIADNIKKIF